MAKRTGTIFRIGLVGPLALLVLAGLAQIDCGGSSSSSSGPTAPPAPVVVVGSGVVAEESRSVTGFDELSLAGLGTVYLEMGGGESLRIEAEDNILPHLQTEVVGGVLEISIAPGVNLEPTRDISYFVSAMQLERASLSGVGAIECDNMSGQRLELESSGVGNLRFDNLDLRRLEVSTSGVATVRTSGAVDTQVVSLSGVGEFKGRHLHSAQAEVSIQSSGSATVRVRDRLVATVSGTGCVYYIGNPTVESSITGPGCVEPIGD